MAGDLDTTAHPYIRNVGQVVEEPREACGYPFG
jgi:hypothetical protein